MMPARKPIVAVVLLITGIGWVINPGVGESFNDEAHKVLSTRAINPGLPNASTLDAYLKNTLQFEFLKGINESLLGGQDGTVAGLIRVGAVHEDQGSRPLRHFHDPTRAWDSAGLFNSVVPPLQSSVVWSQNPSQSPGGRHSWKDARDAYFKALTSTTTSLRKAWYAELFRTLGHLIHLVQDAAVPAHTRNDSHLVDPFLGLKLDADPFHYWADSPVGLNRINNVAQALRFDPSLLNQSSPNPLAPLPISRIIDKTDGDIGILSPNVNIGLAEYSNANFISKGTARSTNYLYPIYSQLTFSDVETLPNGKRVRYAKFRPGFGEQDYRVGVSSRMAQFVNAAVPPDSIDFGLDDSVHEDYGRKLFPRAIGYSAGMIDYFFRGKMDSTELSPTFNWVEWGTQSNSIRVENVSVKVDGTNERGGQGTMHLVLLFRGTDSGETFPPVIVSEPVSVNAGSGQTVVFPFSSLPYPATHPPVYGTYSALYWGMLVYKGSLGQESEAVVADSSCINPTNGSRYRRKYDFQHAIGITLTSGLWQESAYFEGC